MIVVFDADVLIPMILEASRSARLFSRLTNAGHEVVTTPAILQEVGEKLLTKESLRKWLNRPDAEIQDFLDQLPEVCTVYPGTLTAHGAVPADPQDDKIIAAALESSADYMVSEDKHLLKLGRHRNVRIMNRADFAAELDRLGIPEA